MAPAGEFGLSIYLFIFAELCGMQDLGDQIKLVSTALRVQSLNPWTTVEVPGLSICSGIAESVLKLCCSPRCFPLSPPSFPLSFQKYQLCTII